MSQPHLLQAFGYTGGEVPEAKKVAEEPEVFFYGQVPVQKGLMGKHPDPPMPIRTPGLQGNPMEHDFSRRRS
jgi:hypothetical protein